MLPMRYCTGAWNRLRAMLSFLNIFDHSCELRLKLNREVRTQSPVLVAALYSRYYDILCAYSILLISTPTKHSH